MPERGRLGHFWSHFLDLRESGGSNQKMLVHNLEERKKIGEVGFWSLSIGAIVSEKIGFLWKIRENFSFACHHKRKSYVTQKILIPQSCDGHMICSVDCREQNGIPSFSMLPMVWAAGPRKWNFLVFSCIFICLVIFFAMWTKNRNRRL